MRKKCQACDGPPGALADALMQAIDGGDGYGISRAACGSSCGRPGAVAHPPRDRLDKVNEKRASPTKYR